MEAKHPDYDKHYEEWRRTLPDAPHEVIHEKVLAHIAYKEKTKAVAEKVAVMPPAPCRFIDRPIVSMEETNKLLRIVILVAILGLLIFTAALIAKADPEPTAPPVVEFNAAHYLILHPYTFAQVGSVPIPLPVQGSGSSSPVYVICSSGCSAAGAFSDNSAFTVGTTPGSILFGYYTSGSAPTLSSGNAARARIDASSYLFVDCAVGCSGGTFNNNSDAVATSATNGQSAAWLYGFNGTTFDRLRVDGSKNLEVNINASSATVPVSGTFWQTTQPASCTAANCSINLADLDGTALGAPSNYGTSPGAVAVPGVNAYVTNTVPVTGTFYQATQPISAASLPLPSNAAQETGGNLAMLAGGVSSSKFQGNVAQIGGTNVIAQACDSSAAIPFYYDASTNGKTQLVALSSGKKIYVCKLALSQSTSTTVTVSLGSGTGTNCGSTYNAETPAWPLQAVASTGPIGISLPGDKLPWFTTNASEELCISTSAGVSVQVIGTAVQF